MVWHLYHFTAIWKWRSPCIVWYRNLCKYSKQSIAHLMYLFVLKGCCSSEAVEWNRSRRRNLHRDRPCAGRKREYLRYDSCAKFIIVVSSVIMKVTVRFKSCISRGTRVKSTIFPRLTCRPPDLIFWALVSVFYGRINSCIKLNLYWVWLSWGTNVVIFSNKSNLKCIFSYGS